MKRKQYDDQKQKWRTIFIAADAVILLAVLIGFGVMSSKSSSSKAALSDEIGAVKEQLSSIASDQEALSGQLATLQEAVSEADVGEEVMSELTALQSSYDGISQKVDGIASTLSETEAQAALQADITKLKEQSAENRETLDAILASVRDENDRNVLGEVDEVVRILTETEEVTEAPETEETEDPHLTAIASVREQNESLSGRVDELLSAVSALAGSLEKKIAADEEEQTENPFYAEVRTTLAGIQQAVTFIEGEDTEMEGAADLEDTKKAETETNESDVPTVRQSSGAAKQVGTEVREESEAQSVSKAFETAGNVETEEDSGKSGSSEAAEDEGHTEKAPETLAGCVNNLARLSSTQQEAIDNLESEKTAQQSAIDSLESEKTAQQSAIDSLESEKDAQQESIDALESEKNALQESVDGLNETLVLKDEELAAIKEQTQTVADKLDDILTAASDTAATDDISASIASLQEDLASISSKLDTVAETVSDTSADEAISEQINELGGRLDAMSETVNGKLDTMSETVNGKLDTVVDAVNDTSWEDVLVEQISELCGQIGVGEDGSGTVGEQLENIQNTIVDWRESEAAETETDPVIEYVVKRGDTLLGICKAWNIDYYENKALIQELNHKDNLSLIEPGETLILPDTSKNKKKK